MSQHKLTIEPNHKSLNKEFRMNETAVAKRPETQYVAYTEVSTPEGVENSDFIVTKIGTGKKCLTKYELVCLVANVEKCKDMTVEEFFNQSVFTGRDFSGQDFVNAGFRKITTAPGFDAYVNRGSESAPVEPVETPDPTVPGKPFTDYPLVEGGHLKMQQLMDAYSLGRKASETAVEKAKLKSKAAEMDTLQAELESAGLDMAAIRAMIEKKKAKAGK